MWQETAGARIGLALLVVASVGCVDSARLGSDKGRGGAAQTGGGGGTSASVDPTGGAGGTGAVGASGVGPVAYVSGSRLRAHVYDAGDGATLFQYWQDQSLGKPCFFKPMSDGVYRCLPSAPQVAFLDPDCTQAIIYQGDAIAPPWAVDVKQVTCSDSIVDAVYAPGDPLPATPSVIYTRDNPTGCSQSSPPYMPYYVSAKPADLSAFVSATANHDLSARDVSAETLIASDGAQQTIGGWDMGRDAECAPAGARFGEILITDPGSLIDDRCVPRDAAIIFAAAFSDPACSNPLATTVCPPGAAPKVVLAGDASSQQDLSCSLTIEAVGVAVPGSQTYWSTGSDCSANTPAPNYYFATPGPPATAREYPSLRRVETGTGRIKVRSPAAATGPAIALQQTFYDSELATDCLSTSTGSFSSAATVCFPTDARWLSTNNLGLFADAACTTKLYAWDYPCGHPVPAYVLKDFTMPVRAVPYPATTVYANGYKNVVGCVAMTPPPGTTLFSAGDAIPGDTFNPIVEATE